MFIERKRLTENRGGRLLDPYYVISDTRFPPRGVVHATMRQRRRDLRSSHSLTETPSCQNGINTLELTHELRTRHEAPPRVAPLNLPRPSHVSVFFLLLLFLLHPHRQSCIDPRLFPLTSPGLRTWKRVYFFSTSSYLPFNPQHVLQIPLFYLDNRANLYYKRRS